MLVFKANPFRQMLRYRFQWEYIPPDLLNNIAVNLSLPGSALDKYDQHRQLRGSEHIGADRPLPGPSGLLLRCMDCSSVDQEK